MGLGLEFLELQTGNIIGIYMEPRPATAYCYVRTTGDEVKRPLIQHK